MIFSSEQIAAALGSKFPRANIERNWPLICSALEKLGISSQACEIAAAATMGVETGSFSPIKERGGPAYFVRLYWADKDKARELGNLSAEDAVDFRGRGDVMITGRGNYTHYGQRIGVDLVANPDRALDPEVAAGILAHFFSERRIDKLAVAGDWERVRRRVNGGLNGWADFSGYVTRLAALRAPAETTAEQSTVQPAAGPTAPQDGPMPPIGAKELTR